MQQTIVSVVLPVPPDRVDALQAAIDALHAAFSPGDFALLRDELKSLHFMSIMLFGRRAGVAPADPDVNPLFVLEANFDGAPGPFWAQFEAAIGERLRDLLRFCAAPRGAFDELFGAVTAAGSRAPMAPLLERHSVFPAAGHVGARGMSCDRILRHDRLFAAVQQKLPPPADILAHGAAGIHDWLREQMLPGFPDLGKRWVLPVSEDDHRADQRNLAVFAVLALCGAALPWVLLRVVLGALTRDAVSDAAVAAFLTGAACTTRLHDIGNLPTLAGRKAMDDLWWLIGGGLLLVSTVPVFLVRGGVVAWILLLLGGVVASVLLLLAALRVRERRDGAPADSVPHPADVRALQDWEDIHVAGADHMGSVVVIKPGRFRAFVLRVAMRALNLAVRLTAADGYLGSMRTIHFAHWGIVDGGQRLLFLSNFDGSWESYLDDFIEKAHAGLTLAWSNCVGFPTTEYCCLDGATRGRKFKAWARCSMAQSRFWYAAYPNLTVNQIWRQARVARGLTAPRLTPAQAALWAKDL